MNYKVIDNKKIENKSNTILETSNQRINQYEDEYNKIQSDLKLYPRRTKSCEERYSARFYCISKAYQ